MQPNSTRWYGAHEFAELAGVTARTLHHYDHISLLKPSRPTASAYRQITDRDLARLEQIVVLKFLGDSERLECNVRRPGELAGGAEAELADSPGNSRLHHEGHEVRWNR